MVCTKAFLYKDSSSPLSPRIYKYQAHGYAFSGVEELLYSLGESSFINMTQRSVAESLLHVGVTQRFIDDIVSAVLRASYGQSAAMPAFAGEPVALGLPTCPSLPTVPSMGWLPITTSHLPGSVRLPEHLVTPLDSGIGPPGWQEMYLPHFTDGKSEAHVSAPMGVCYSLFFFFFF